MNSVDACGFDPVISDKPEQFSIVNLATFLNIYNLSDDDLLRLLDIIMGGQQPGPTDFGNELQGLAFSLVDDNSEETTIMFKYPDTNPFLMKLSELEEHLNNYVETTAGEA